MQVLIKMSRQSTSFDCKSGQKERAELYNLPLGFFFFGGVGVAAGGAEQASRAGWRALRALPGGSQYWTTEVCCRNGPTELHSQPLGEDRTGPLSRLYSLTRTHFAHVTKINVLVPLLLVKKPFSVFSLSPSCLPGMRFSPFICSFPLYSDFILPFSPGAHSSRHGSARLFSQPVFSNPQLLPTAARAPGFPLVCGETSRVTLGGGRASKVNGVGCNGPNLQLVETEAAPLKSVKLGGRTEAEEQV